MTDVTNILGQMEDGDPTAAEKLLPLVYEELRKLATQKLSNEKPGQTLQATALVHEAYLRLLGNDHESNWDNRGHFFAAAAEAMRRILVENARRKNQLKRGADFSRIELDDVIAEEESSTTDLLALNDALGELEQHDPQAAVLVKLRYFSGLSHTDSAAAMGISRRAADRLWSLARAWLFRRLAESGN